MAEYLIGGGVQTGKSSERAQQDPAQLDATVPQVGWRFMAIVLAIAGSLATVGALHVGRVFEVRDAQMEASRLQQIGNRRSDRVAELTARIAHLQRGGSLAAAGEQALGMLPPAPGTVEQLVISAEAQSRWEQAAAQILEDSRKEVQ